MIFNRTAIQAATTRLEKLSELPYDHTWVFVACSVILVVTAIEDLTQSIREKPPWIHPGVP